MLKLLPVRYSLVDTNWLNNSCLLISLLFIVFIQVSIFTWYKSEEKKSLKTQSSKFPLRRLYATLSICYLNKFSFSIERWLIVSDNLLQFFFAFLQFLAKALLKYYPVEIVEWGMLLGFFREDIGICSLDFRFVAHFSCFMHGRFYLFVESKQIDTFVWSVFSFCGAWVFTIPINTVSHVWSAFQAKFNSETIYIMPCIVVHNFTAIYVIEVYIKLFTCFSLWHREKYTGR